MSELVMCFQSFTHPLLQGPFVATPVSLSSGRVVPLGCDIEVRAVPGALSNPMEPEQFKKYLANLSLTDKARKFINQQMTEKNMSKAIKVTKTTKHTGPAKAEGKPATKAVAKPAVKTAAKEETSGKRGRAPKISDDAKITVLVSENPKRGSAAERFSFYKSGISVGAFIAKGGTRGDVMWDIKAGNISVNG